MCCAKSRPTARDLKQVAIGRNKSKLKTIVLPKGRIPQPAPDRSLPGDIGCSRRQVNLVHQAAVHQDTQSGSMRHPARVIAIVDVQRHVLLIAVKHVRRNVEIHGNREDPSVWSVRHSSRWSTETPLPSAAISEHHPWCASTASPPQATPPYRQSTPNDHGSLHPGFLRIIARVRAAASNSLSLLPATTSRMPAGSDGLSRNASTGPLPIPELKA